MIAAALLLAASQGPLEPVETVRATPDPARPELLELVPEEALLVAATAAFDDVRSRASENEWVRFLRDERWQPVYSTVLQGRSLASILEEEDLGWLSPQEALAAVHGSTVFFVAPRTRAEVLVGVFVAPDEPAARFHELYDRLALRLEEEAQASSRSDYAGVELLVLEAEDPDRGGGVLFEGAGLAGFLASDSLEGALEGARLAIDRWQGEDTGRGFAAGELADTLFHADEARPPALRLAVDLGRIAALALEEEPDEEAREAIDILGLDRLEWAELTADVGTGEELEIAMRLHLPDETLPGRFAALLAPLPADLLGWMPASSFQIALYGYDLAGAYRVVEEVVGRFEPDAVEGMRSGIEGFGEAFGVHPVDDLLGRFDGRFGSFSMKISEDEFRTANPFLPAEAELYPQGPAYLIGLRDVEAFRRATEKLLEATGLHAMMRTEPFQGTEIQTLSFGGPSLHFAWLPDGLVLSQFPTPLREVVRRVEGDDAASAETVELFRRAAERHAGSSMLTVADTATALEAAIAAIDGLGALMAAVGEADDEAQAMLRALAGSWPDPSIAREYFDGESISVVRRDGDVLELHAFTR